MVKFIYKLFTNFKKKEYYSLNTNTLNNNFKKKDFGFSINEMVLTIIVLSIISGIFIPKFLKSIEFFEFLIAEKHLLKSVKQCQIGLINGETNPQYYLPLKISSIRFNRRNIFKFRYTGIEGECKSNFSFNKLSVSKKNINNDNFEYSLIINLITGQKTSEGTLPIWLDWWEGKYSPLIPLNDPLLD